MMHRLTSATTCARHDVTVMQADGVWPAPLHIAACCLWMCRQTQPCMLSEQRSRHPHTSQVCAHTWPVNIQLG